MPAPNNDGWTIDPPRVICANDRCANELLCDRRHAQNLIDSKWQCGMCTRGWTQ